MSKTGRLVLVMAASILLWGPVDVTRGSQRNATAAWPGVQAPVAAAAIAGCVTDTSVQVMPGVTIVAKAEGIQRSVLTDGAGCYELGDLPPASYRVTARVAGFDNITRDKISIVPGTRTRLDFKIRASAICECLAPPTTLTGLWEHADAIIYVRLTDHEFELTAPAGFFKHTALVLDVVKRHADGGPDGPATTILEDQRRAAPGPYDVGQELVMFVGWSPSDHTFVVYRDTNTVFLVQAGRIVRAPDPALSRYEGMGVDEFLRALRR
jgi:hypothetical protein